MSFKTRYPDFAGIEYHIRQARAERMLYLGTHIADLIFAAYSGIKNLVSRATAAKPFAPITAKPRASAARPVAQY